MRRVLILTIILLLITGCGVSEEELMLTEIPKTQTVEWGKRDEYLQCLVDVLEEINNYDDASESCNTQACIDDLANKIEAKSEELPTICPIPDPCAKQVEIKFQRLILTRSYLTRGPNPKDNQRDQEEEYGVLLKQWISANEYFWDTVNNSCIRRN